MATENEGFTGQKQNRPTERFDLSAALEEVAELTGAFDAQALMDSAPKEGEEDWGVPDLAAELAAGKTPEPPGTVSDQETTPPADTEKPDENLRVRDAQLQAQFEAYTQATERRLQEQLKGLQPHPTPEPQQQDEEDFSDPLQTIRDLKQTVNLLQQQNELRVQHDVKQRFESAVERVTAKYPDLLDHVPRAHLEAGLAYALNNRQYDADFSGIFEQAYKLNAFESVKARAAEAAQRKQEADELSTKREAKRQAANAVSGGGHPYQQPEFKASDSTIKGSRQTFLQEYLASGG